MGGVPAVDVVLYVAQNLVNGNEYVGVASCGVKKRRREHRFAARHGSKLRFHNALRKYGEDKFEFVVLERFETYDAALRREREVIAERRPIYNLTAGGEGALGYKMPTHIKEQLAAMKRGTVGYWKGKKRPAETVEKMRAAKLNNPPRYWLGKKRDAETNAKISATKTGVPRKPAPEHALAVFAENMRRAARARRKKVRCLDDGLIFDSAVDAGKYYGLSKIAINGVCNPKRPNYSIHGKHFEYTGE